MEKFLLIPDSFKGTMSSLEICGIMAGAIKKHLPEASVKAISVADGGEGSVDAFLSSMGGKKKYIKVRGPNFEEVEAFYGLIQDGSTAIIEMAACAGLPLSGANCDAMRTTTYGVGELILDAARSGCRRVIMGLGGSATNDGGCGAAAAVGVLFSDADGKSFVPVGGTLAKIARVDLSQMAPELKDLKITTMCDIDNPLYGETGAAYVFGPQKGATAQTLPLLDAGLRSFASVVKKELGADCAEMPGAGAAGGMGYGMRTLFGSELKMGIETVLDTVGFDELAKEADIVFTGEGKIDGQSLRGKVVIGVARRAKKQGTPVIAVVGDIANGIETVYNEGVSAIFSINRVAVSYQQAKPRAKDDLRLTMEDIMRFLKMAEAAGHKTSR
ncbi:MAG: glycerate kinase [Cloacibacillus sp.]